MLSFQIPDHPVLSVAVMVTARDGAVPVVVMLTVGATVSTPILILRASGEMFPAVSRTATVAPLSDVVIVRVYRMMSAQTVGSGIPGDQRSGVVDVASTAGAQAHVSPSETPGASVQVTTAVTLDFCHLVGAEMSELAERDSDE